MRFVCPCVYEENNANSKYKVEFKSIDRCPTSEAYCSISPLLPNRFQFDEKFLKLIPIINPFHNGIACWDIKCTKAKPLHNNSNYGREVYAYMIHSPDVEATTPRCEQVYRKVYATRKIPHSRKEMSGTLQSSLNNRQRWNPFAYAEQRWLHEQIQRFNCA